MSYDPKRIDPNKVKRGPIRHQALPLELLETIGAVYKSVDRYLDTTLEQFEICFMREMQPETEVAIWCNIAAALNAYQSKYAESRPLAVEEGKRILSALILISAGVDDPSKLNVTVEVGERLLECYG